MHQTGAIVTTKSAAKETETGAKFVSRVGFTQTLSDAAMPARQYPPPTAPACTSAAAAGASRQMSLRPSRLAAGAERARRPASTSPSRLRRPLPPLCCSNIYLP